MRPTDRPDMMYLTGGEALLRPSCRASDHQRAHEVGTRVALLSGMFFARQPRGPTPIAEAIAQVDHFAASMDVFHESQVPRAEVFRVMRDLLNAGQGPQLPGHRPGRGRSLPGRRHQRYPTHVRRPHSDPGGQARRRRPGQRLVRRTTGRPGASAAARLRPRPVRHGRLANSQLRRHHPGVLQSGRRGRFGSAAPAPGPRGD